ncbi:hypothetical protein RND71_043540 [Anisodus tanguticus]|uniref:Uncharacterized protein n=1 Tax=Anisodus tanguticus TaxID=243964 RepID=A0AAE1QQK6_9SOLA|nr:hypothetical protein RND71_043540 [Anisodus tanguticus]
MFNIKLLRLPGKGFMPHGWHGVFAASASCFYAYIGFDSIATSGEEAKNPQRSIPIATIISMAFATVSYVSVSAVLTLMVPYDQLSNESGLPDALGRYNSAQWAKYLVVFGASCGMISVLIGTMYSLTRIVYSMADDGLLYSWMGQINKSTQIPLKAMYFFAGLGAILALTFELTMLVEMMSIGTLLAYLVVSASVIIARYKPGDSSSHQILDESDILPGEEQELSELPKTPVNETLNDADEPIPAAIGKSDDKFQAAENGNLKEFERLYKIDNSRLSYRNSKGRTCVHFAAAANKLTELKSNPKETCDNGYAPIHEAARNASAKALKAILENGEVCGYSNEDLMSCFDAEGNVPLHSAVHAGDIKAVEICLQYGSKISSQQHDLSTPLHLACAQGALEIVKLMLENNPSETERLLSILDAQQMTPIHCAAMFDHADLVEYLCLMGADLHLEDKDGRTVLLLASARAAWKSVQALIKNKAKIEHKDSINRNLLHHIVMSDGDVNLLNTEINQVTNDSNVFLSLLNEKDIFGCTPLHYASKEGNLKTVNSLLNLGASISVKNNDNQSALHFAARLRNISKTLDQQLQMIKLIVKKVEVQTENDYNDYSSEISDDEDHIPGNVSKLTALSTKK